MCAALRRNLLLRSLWVVLAIGTAQVQVSHPRQSHPIPHYTLHTTHYTPHATPHAWQYNAPSKSKNNEGVSRKTRNSNSNRNRNQNRCRCRDRNWNRNRHRHRHRHWHRGAAIAPTLTKRIAKSRYYFGNPFCYLKSHICGCCRYH